MRQVDELGLLAGGQIDEDRDGSHDEPPAGRIVAERAREEDVAIREPDGDGQTVAVVDLRTGARTEIAASVPGTAFRLPIPLRLPVGWVILATSLADHPGGRAIPRDVPVALNLDTGEQIGLVTLPHTIESTP